MLWSVWPSGTRESEAGEVQPRCTRKYSVTCTELQRAAVLLLEQMEEMCQAQPEKSSDLIMGNFSILYVKFGLKMFPMGFFIHFIAL